MFVLIKMYRASEKDIDTLVSLRLEMLKEVNDLGDGHVFTPSFTESVRSYFLNGDQSTWIVIEDEPVCCASISYFDIMPTFSHPSGKRAQIMNVYTKKDYRRQGYATTLIELLIEEAKDKGVTEIRLDSTDIARGVYTCNGFEESEECMVLDINRLLKNNIEKAEKYGCKSRGCGSCGGCSGCG